MWMLAFFVWLVLFVFGFGFWFSPSPPEEKLSFEVLRAPKIWNIQHIFQTGFLYMQFKRNLELQLWKAEWVEFHQELPFCVWRYRKHFWRLVVRDGDFLFLSPISLITLCSMSRGTSVGCRFLSKILNATSGCRFWGRNCVSVWVSGKLYSSPHVASLCKMLMRSHRKKLTTPSLYLLGVSP